MRISKAVLEQMAQTLLLRSENCFALAESPDFAKAKPQIAEKLDTLGKALLADAVAVLGHLGHTQLAPR